VLEVVQNGSAQILNARSVEVSLGEFLDLLINEGMIEKVIFC
jgi:hypothetical protein